jgi:hypothetical protein
MDTTTWIAEITFDEDDERTRARVTLTTGPSDVHGRGHARRSPGDPDVPVVGEEIAAARALVDLAHGLLDRAAERIETWEGHEVHLSS